MYDLKITNASIVDGTGSSPFSGDIGIAEGRIVAVGDAPDNADQTIDATGRVVSPGFIDIHTHLDAQILWDPMMGMSPWHGVTTVVMGNCGFGVAPTRTEHRELILRTLENVEGMSFECLTEGLGGDWGFETFPEYLTLLENRGSAINVAVLVGHTPIRLYVMGPEAADRAATPDEITKMHDLVLEALEAGAIGISSSKTPSHAGFEGKPVPSRLAEWDEIRAISSTMGEVGYGIFECSIGPGLSLPELQSITESTGRPTTFAAILAGLGGPGEHRRLLERTERIQAQGHQVVPQVSCRPVLLEYTLRDPYPLTNGAPGLMKLQLLDELFRPIYQEHTTEGRLAAYREPDFRKKFKELTDSDGWHSMLWATTIINAVPGRTDLEQRPLLEVANELELHPSEVVLDLGLATNLEARFLMGFLNGDESEVEHLLMHPGTQVGLSDAGAHVGQICDACFPTYLLGHWVRERQSIRLEQAIAMLTGEAASLLGLTDRGLLAPGLAADIVILNPDTVHSQRPERRFDFPNGSEHLVAESTGIDYVIVNGTVVRAGNEDRVGPRDGLPGKLLRGGVSTLVQKDVQEVRVPDSVLP